MGKPFLILNSIVAKEIISYPCNNEKGYYPFGLPNLSKLLFP
ncbi:Uncharacterised protein [Sphingobacterium spiritivorum]|jgi:hypothetical protein|nr:Uncharacterised protein [Sphingobacterium spiritivorum]